MKMIGMALALCCSAAVAKTSAPAKASAGDTELAGHLHDVVARSFVLPRDLPLDPELRAAAEDIRASHLARIDQLLPTWIKEERQQPGADGKPPGATAVYFAIWSRLLNELALWQVEPGDSAYEAATLAVLTTSPLVCESWGDPRFTDFSSRMLRVQAMPVTERPAALASERVLLSHWGQPRASLAAFPDPFPQDAAMQVVKRMRDGGERPALALSPMLAQALLAKKQDIADMHPEDQCALQQWWLRVSLQQGGTPESALAAFRYGTMITARDRLAGMFDPPPGDDGAAAPAQQASGKPSYPKMAARFDVTGTTTISIQLDESGKPTQARVIDRKIRVTGIRGVRAVAFENVFDKPSVEMALATPKFPKQANGEPFKYQMVWSLDSEDQGERTASHKPATPSATTSTGTKGVHQ